MYTLGVVVYSGASIVREASALLMLVQGGSWAYVRCRANN